MAEDMNPHLRRAYHMLHKQISTLSEDGNDDTSETEFLRDVADFVWWAMSQAEQEQVREEIAKIRESPHRVE